jgi:hypothetical protein
MGSIGCLRNRMRSRLKPSREKSVGRIYVEAANGEERGDTSTRLGGDQGHTFGVNSVRHCEEGVGYL